MFDVRSYVPPGETIRRFHESSAFTRMVAGPIGSAKTTGCMVAEPFFVTMLQRPDSQGVRTASVGILRDTYRNLYATTMKTWHAWVPKDVGKFVGSDDRPASHDLEFHAPYTDGTRGMGLCRLRMEWRALGSSMDVEATCRGWELMAAGVDEADLVPIETFSFLSGRVQRGGQKAYRVSRGVWGVFNKPDTDHPLYDLCVERAGEHDPADFEFFDQPGGLLPGGPPYRTNPAAENLQNLDDGYYERAANGQPEWYIRRMLRNQWGASVAGEPVFLEFDPDRHVSPVELEPEPGTDLVLGLDGGGTPAAVVLGRDRRTGRRIIYAEVVLVDPTDPRGRRLLTGVGPKRFAEAIGDTLHPRFSKCRLQIAYGDPANFHGADKEAGEYAFMEKVALHLKVGVVPAPSNAIAVRLEAVRTPLNRSNTLDGRPDLLINPSCRVVRRGFGGDYKWEPRDPRQPAKALRPQKTTTSHVMDAAQYALLGDQGHTAVMAGQAFDPARPKAAPGFRETASGLVVPASYADGPTSYGQGAGGASYRSDWSPWDS